MTVQPRIDLSIVIPAKDEEYRLPGFLLDLISYCQSSSLKYEIIVVDDGSVDRTSEIVKRFQSKFSKLHLIKLRQNRGKGFAVKSGVLRSEGEVVAFMDADGSTPPQEIEANLHYFDSGCDIVIGSRVLHDSRHTVKAKPYRRLIGQVFNFLVHTFLFKTIQDTQCGFKMFKKKAILPLFSRLNINRFGFDLELLYLAQKMNFRTKEIPVNWHHVDASKTNLFLDSLKMFINIFQIRSWHLKENFLEVPHMSDQEIESMYTVEKEHWWFQSKNAFIQSIIKKSGRQFDHILDAGCGTGLNLSYLMDHGNCFGCDAVHQALKFSRRNGVKNLTLCNLERMSFKSAQFDLITALDVIEHTEQPQRVVPQLMRTLKRDGMMVVTVPAFKFLWSQHDEALSHFRRYHKEELRLLLSDAGLEVKQIGYFFCTAFLFAAPIRIINRIFRRKDNVQSDTVRVPSMIVNKIFKTISQLEIKILSFLPLPFGTTLYAVVQNSNNPANITTFFQADSVQKKEFVQVLSKA